jgi:chaperone modulatory protein CbpM
MASRHELSWLDQRETVTVTELTRVCALTVDELDELVEYGALKPLQPAPQERVFSAEYVMPLRQAGKLRRDYDLDLFAVAMMLEHLRRIDDLEREIRSLHAWLPSQMLPRS